MGVSGTIEIQEKKQLEMASGKQRSGTSVLKNAASDNVLVESVLS